MDRDTAWRNVYINYCNISSTNQGIISLYFDGRLKRRSEGNDSGMSSSARRRYSADSSLDRLVEAQLRNRPPPYSPDQDKPPSYEESFLDSSSLRQHSPVVSSVSFFNTNFPFYYRHAMLATRSLPVLFFSYRHNSLYEPVVCVQYVFTKWNISPDNIYSPNVNSNRNFLECNIFFYSLFFKFHQIVEWIIL